MNTNKFIMYSNMNKIYSIFISVILIVIIFILIF